MYIDALAEAAVRNGMDRKQALTFAAQAVLGAAKMVLETGIDPVQLRLNVCSPGGTTIDAVQKLQEKGFEETVEAGFQAAVDKSIKMTGK
jgi:pyrroline-5-carboxylate reductase